MKTTVKLPIFSQVTRFQPVRIAPYPARLLRKGDPHDRSPSTNRMFSIWAFVTVLQLFFFCGVCTFVLLITLPVVMPDLYRGNPWPNKPIDNTLADWFKLHPLDRIRDDLVATVKALRDRGFGTPLGLIGFCFGGGRIMDEISLAEEGLDPASAVTFYPTSKLSSHALLGADPWVRYFLIEQDHLTFPLVPEIKQVSIRTP